MAEHPAGRRPQSNPNPLTTRAQSANKPGMPSLRDLKNRIASVKSTRKITSAMKMVAASKLRRAQESAEMARPYAELMARMLASLSANLVITDMTPKLIAGTGSDKTVLLVVMTSD